LTVNFIKFTGKRRQKNWTAAAAAAAAALAARAITSSFNQETTIPLLSIKRQQVKVSFKRQQVKVSFKREQHLFFREGTRLFAAVKGGRHVVLIGDAACP